ncbi:MAG: ABC transporter ATP-binding protein [Lachnospiraceae bacterium]|nr:ABC transporter ATP-binding protein [Lachnospiraceae bacterium]
MFKYLKKYWIFALLAPLFMVGEVLMDLIQPRMMNQIVDEGVLGLSHGGVGDLNVVLHSGVLMIGVVFAGGFFGVMSGVFANMCSQNFGNDIRKDCFRRIMSLSLEQTDRFSTGSLITRVTNDVTQVQNMVAQCIRGFVRTCMLFFGGIVCILSLDLSFGVIVLCAFPLVLISVIFFISRVNPLFGILQKKLDRVNSVMQENVTGARVVKAYVKEEYEQKRFRTANDELVGTQLRVLVLLSYMTPIMNIIMNVSVVAVIAVGSVQVQAGGVTPGNVMAAITYLSQILNSVTMLAMIFQTVSRGTASMKRLDEILKCQPAIADGVFQEEDHRDGSERGTVEFRDVSFAYPQMEKEEVLSHINLKIKSGETFAILGATGCGKSSLVNLIPRFYDITQGEVLVDGINVKDYPLTDLRNKVAIALQKSELFSESISENIRWGNEGATDEQVEKAAGIAQAQEFISQQPQGYETMVAEKGMSLSGGQKQRIAISRAILKNAEILIFDDSTSALDLMTEAKLYEALNRDYQDVTKIIIAQRIASVKNADRIAVIENGSIAACGTHEELMESSDIYRDIYTSQLKAGGESNE